MQNILKLNYPPGITVTIEYQGDWEFDIRSEATPSAQLKIEAGFCPEFRAKTYLESPFARYDRGYAIGLNEMSGCFDTEYCLAGSWLQSPRIPIWGENKKDLVEFINNILKESDGVFDYEELREIFGKGKRVATPRWAAYVLQQKPAVLWKPSVKNPAYICSNMKLFRPCMNMLADVWMGSTMYTGDTWIRNGFLQLLAKKYPHDVKQ